MFLEGKGNSSKQPQRMLRLDRCIQEYCVPVVETGNCTRSEGVKNDVPLVVMSLKQDQ